MQNRVLIGVIALWAAVGASAQTLSDLVQRAEQAEKAGRYAEAVLLYMDARQEADPSHPDFPRLRVILLLREAWARSNDGQLQAALQVVKQAQHYAERDPQVQKVWKELQLRAGDKLVTAEDISDALKLVPKFAAVSGKPPSVSVPVPFGFDSAELTEQGERQAQEILKFMRGQGAGQRFRLVGHTDTRGSASYNMGLSRRRAESLREWLLERSELAAERIETRGLGESEPVLPAGDSEAEHARNRRVELQLLR